MKMWLFDRIIQILGAYAMPPAKNPLFMDAYTIE